MKTVFILSVTSDIGIELTKKYHQNGYKIIGTYRSKSKLNQLEKLVNCNFYYCDLLDKDSVNKLMANLQKLKLKWDIFISCPCTPLPLKPFFESNFDEWEISVHVNVIEQLRVLHLLYNSRNRESIANVVFFAGGGINNSVVNFSAYTASKIMLIKMCEFLDAENSDLNIFIVGPGWTRTKTHSFVLSNLDEKDVKYGQIIEFLKNGTGTSMDDIYNCINWLIEKGKSVASGRNFSVVNDAWKGKNKELLANELIQDLNMYKLRRSKNDFLINKG